MDIVAFQEVLSEGKVLLSLERRLGRNWKSYWEDPKPPAKNYPYLGDNRHEGYAFLWNTEKFEPAPVSKGKNPCILNNYHVANGIDGIRLKRDPLYGRFREKKLGFEIRLITTHIICNKPEHMRTEVTGGPVSMRRNEFNILAGDIYSSVADDILNIHQNIRRNTLPDPRRPASYTILLGDYNLNLESSSVHSATIPDVTCFDAQGRRVEDAAHARRVIYTVQKGLTSLSPLAYTNNFDHFSYDERSRRGIVKGEAKRIDTVRKYPGTAARTEEEKFTDYFNSVSDHVPIVIEIDFK